MAHNLFEQPNEFDADIDTLVDDAYAENLAAGRVVLGEFADKIAADALQTQLDTIQNSSDTSADKLAMEQIKNNEIRRAFILAFAHTKGALTHGGEKPPSPREFHMLAGIDFGRLASIYEDMLQRDLNPQVVIAPHIQSLEYWRSVLEEARARTAYLHSDIVRGTALFVWDDVITWWNEVNNLPADTPNFKNWTVRIVPGMGTDAPNDRYTRCITASEYLAVQAVRFRFNQPLLNEINGGAGPKTLLRNNNSDSPIICGRAGSVSRQVEIGFAGTDQSGLPPSKLHIPEW